MPETTDHPKDLIYAQKRIIPISQGNTVFRIRQISDTHQDAEFFRADLLREFIKEQSRDKNSVWIHTGDLPDADRPSTRMMKRLMYADRTEAFEQEDKKNIAWLERSIIPAYQKITESCLGILDGDHYLVFANGTTSGQYISKRLRVPYLGERSAFVNLSFMSQSMTGGLQYVIHARHGKGSAPTGGGDMNALVRQEVGYQADLHLGGHSHKENCHPVRVDYVNSAGAIRSKIAWYMRGGSFLDGFPQSPKKTYAYRKEYSPLPCGWGEVELTIGRIYHGNGKSRPYGITRSKASIIAA